MCNQIQNIPTRAKIVHSRCHLSFLTACVSQEDAQALLRVHTAWTRTVSLTQYSEGSPRPSEVLAPCGVRRGQADLLILSDGTWLIMKVALRKKTGIAPQHTAPSPRALAGKSARGNRFPYDSVGCQASWEVSVSVLENSRLLREFCASNSG